MGHKLLQAGPVGQRAAAILAKALDSSTLSLRGLSTASGVKLTRLGDVLRRGKPLTVSELDTIADALGLVGWRVMREAEGGLRNLSAVPSSPETPMSVGSVSDEEIEEAMRLPYAARERTPGPDSQDVE